MTAIYGILNKRMKLLSNILLVLICLAMTTELSCLRGVKRINVKENIVQHHRFSPYRGNLRLLLREPPLKGQESLVHKDLVQERWMEQKVDHFDEANNSTWLMHYFRNDRYFQAAGPIFIFVGGEWEISPVYLLAGHMHDIAKQHNGMLYYVEHRFYGNSWPLGDAAMENLKFLSARQAIADLAHFIRQLKAIEDVLADSKVILTGASYSGSLVTWFAKLYPKLISAGWASSAPLVAKMDFYEYMQQVGKVIQHRGGHECAKRLEAGLTAMAAILESSNTSQLMRPLRICNNFEATNQLDRAALFNGIGNYFAAYVQLYDDQIPYICASLTKPTDKDDMVAFIEFFMHIFWPEALERIHSDGWCNDLSYEGMKSIFTDITDRLSGTRQWFYQSCREFGWFATTATRSSNDDSSHNIRLQVAGQTKLLSRHEQPSPLTHSFGRQVPLNYFQQLCRDVFGPLAGNWAGYNGDDIFTSVQQTNSHFGGLAAATTLQQRVIFTHGQLDPWRAVGLQQGKNVINIADYSHTADLDSINFSDSLEMNVAKLKVAAFLRRALRKTTTTTARAKHLY